MSKRGGRPRNVLTYLDDQGLYRDLIRDEGESVSQFKQRVLTSMARLPGPTVDGLTHAIDIGLHLGQDYLISLSTDSDYYLEVNNTQLIISGSIYNEISLINIDAAGYWFPKPLYQLQKEINNISGVICTLETSLSGLPSFLLEQQSSYKSVEEEQVPISKRFRLGASDGLEWTDKKLVLNEVRFSNQEIFREQISGVPSKEGQWSAEEEGWINLYSNPSDLYFVDYQYNTFISGQSIKLVGNGVKVINLCSPEAQEYLLNNSGENGESRIVSQELLNQDKMFWGK